MAHGDKNIPKVNYNAFPNIRFFKLCVSMSKKLTRIRLIHIGHPGVLYETVCQLSKHNKIDRKHCPVDHGHHRPNDDQHNVAAIGKSELHSSQKEKTAEYYFTKLIINSTFFINQAS